VNSILHIIQNDPEVPPGNLLDHLTIPFIVHHPYRGDRLPEIGDISALIVMGGAMGANDHGRYPFLIDLKNLIRAVVAARIPFLGVCLGGQLLAAAVGAEVVSHRWEESGALTVSLTEAGKIDPLFKGITEEFATFQWHHDSFDLPDGAVLLAISVACPHQAFRVGESAWGLQFHPEVTEKIIRDWCAWDSSSGEKTEMMVAAFVRNELPYTAVVMKLVHNFLLQCPPKMAFS
jgi:GMP synthase-like glutamine amidotransferase